jgi:hypothetical protein
MATFHADSAELDRFTAPEKKGSRPNPQHTGGSIHGSPPIFSALIAIEAVT